MLFRVAKEKVNVTILFVGYAVGIFKNCFRRQFRFQPKSQGLSIPEKGVLRPFCFSKAPLERTETKK